MADRIRRVDYYYIQVPDKPGEGMKVLGKLKEAGANLLAFTAFPVEGGKAQIDLVAENGEVLNRAAKSGGLILSARKQAFYIQGKDRAGAVADTFKRLSDAKVNVHAANASVGPDGGFGFILWVKPQQFEAAAKALGV
jgi:hypothetical protein